MKEAGVTQVDGVTLDLGVSSPQLDEAARGFSFRADGPLDMRMGGDDETATAAEFVNAAPEAELADVLHRYGEERQARRIARAIVTARAERPILRTGELAEIVRGIVKTSAKDHAVDPATRTFLALRIHVNDELGEVRRGLVAAEHVLAPGGRLAVVSFHSLEDRIVKQFLAARSGRAGRGSRHLPETGSPDPSFQLIARRALKPSAAEIERNPRSRSARLRVAERTAAPSWPRMAAA